MPDVADVVSEARAACDALARHPGLDRTLPMLRAEAALQAAHAGLALDGVRLPIETVRDIERGLAVPPYGPAGSMVVGALRVQVEVQRAVEAAAGRSPGPPRPLPHLVAGWHTAAVAGSGMGEPGRLRGQEQPGDLRGLGAAPVGDALAQRMAALAALVAVPLPIGMSGLVLAAVVHGELLALRPFASANAMVARAVLRWQLAQTGVDRTGTVVPEVVWADAPDRYLSAAAGYATGEHPRVVTWVRAVSAAVVRGAVTALALVERADGR